LIGAIFLIVVVASLATFMVTIGSVQQTTSVYSLMSSRAQFAVEGGMQWAIGYVIANDACFAAPNDTFTLSGGASDGYTVTLTCLANNVDEGPDNYNVFHLTAVAEKGTIGGVDYYRRKLMASVTTAP
jgi:hypothetical protein